MATIPPVSKGLVIDELEAILAAAPAAQGYKEHPKRGVIT